MLITGIKTPLFNERELLFGFLKKNIISLTEGSVVVITSKIVALSEGRTASIKEKHKIIIKESKKVIKTPWGFLTLTKDGWGINAGIDESNARKKIILLPKNSFKTAKKIRHYLKKLFFLKKLGVLITDTRSVPLRVGTIGRALGYAGFEPIKSYIGKKDLFGRKSRITVSNLADALATASVLIMGEGNEQIPMAIIEDAPVVFTNRSFLNKAGQLAFPADKDIFSSVFK